MLKENEFNFFTLIDKLLEYKALIFTISSLSLIFAIAYSLFSTTFIPSYSYKTYISTTDDASIYNLNANIISQRSLDLTPALIKPTWNKTNILLTFIKNISYDTFQKDVFDNNEYSERFKSINDEKTKITFNSVISNLSIKKEKHNDLLENIYSISISSQSREILEPFMNDLISAGNANTVSEIREFNNLKNQELLNSLKRQEESLLSKAKNQRLNQIKQIKEKDLETINELNLRINSLRSIAEQNRLNEIVRLSDAAELAKSLGIIENNFNQITPMSLPSNISKSSIDYVIPEWYLYGEKALKKKIKVLELRENDDSFIPELVEIQNKIREIKENPKLKRLEARLDDSPYIVGIDEIKSKISYFNSHSSLELIKPTTSVITKINYGGGSINIIGKNKRSFVIAVFLMSLIMSFTLSLLLSYRRSL
jgi:LPS O-antigen subunit length determinant protein (WzzB/FepE family)